MVSRIESNKIQLEYILSSIQRKRDKIGNQEYEKLIGRIAKRLSELESASEQGFSSATEWLRKDTIKVLSDLNVEISKSGISTETTGKISSRILDVKSKIQETPAYGKKEMPKPPKIGLKVAFMCDIDCDDYNASIASRLEFMLEGNTPIVTSRSMIKCTGVGDDTERSSEMEQLEEKLLKTKDNWDIYQSGEFLVFLPKSLLPEKSGLEKLEALDLAADGSLKQVSVREALQGPKGKKDIHSFFNLFSQQPKIGKLFYIDGHGTLDSTAALSKDHYIEFLKFLETQNCQGLTVHSCFSGGTTALFYLPRKEEGKDITSFEDQLEGLSFPIIVRSIGDFPTLSSQAEREYDLYFRELTSYLEGPGAKTYLRFRKMLERVEKGKMKKVPQNLVQVYFPHSPDIPGGFRPVGEGGRGHLLTYRAAKVGEMKKGIAIKDREFLEVNPLVILAPIRCTEKDPILLSMIPGNGHHVMKSIELA